MRPDLKVRNEGSIWLFIPQNDECQAWLESHTNGMWFGGALVVEWRYAEDLAVGLTEAGFRITDCTVQARLPEVLN